MLQIRNLILFLILAFPFLAGAQSLNPWQTELQKEVEIRISKHQFLDGAFGVISRHQIQISLFGSTNTDELFEIGSVTKLFTGILFSELVLEQTVNPTDTVSTYIPELAGTSAGQILLSELANHTSGLEKTPSDVPKDSNPYVNYQWTQLLTYLKTVQLDPSLKGADHHFPAKYSNTGFALLGEVLSRATSTSYADLLKARILNPLGMNQTNLRNSSEQTQSFMSGHNESLESVPHWDFQAFAPAGAMKSNLNDMLLFVKAKLYPDDSHLGEAIKLSQRESWGWDNSVISVPFFYKNGATGGFRSVLLIDTKRDLGLVILTDTSVEADSLIVPIVQSFPVR